MYEAQIFLSGPEGCGKSTFVQQLRSIYETRELVWPAAKLIKISPTTGKEIFHLSFNGGRVVKRPLTKEWVRSQVGMSRQGERLLRRWENTPIGEFDVIPSVINIADAAKQAKMEIKKIEGDMKVQDENSNVRIVKNSNDDDNVLRIIGSNRNDDKNSPRKEMQHQASNNTEDVDAFRALHGIVDAITTNTNESSSILTATVTNGTTRATVGEGGVGVGGKRDSSDALSIAHGGVHNNNNAFSYPYNPHLTNAASTAAAKRNPSSSLLLAASEGASGNSSPVTTPTAARHTSTSNNKNNKNNNGSEVSMMVGEIVDITLSLANNSLCAGYFGLSRSRNGGVGVGSSVSTNTNQGQASQTTSLAISPQNNSEENVNNNGGVGGVSANPISPYGLAASHRDDNTSQQQQQQQPNNPNDMLAGSNSVTSTTANLTIGMILSNSNNNHHTAATDCSLQATTTTPQSSGGGGMAQQPAPSPPPPPPNFPPTINITAVTALQRNNDTDATHRGGRTGNNSTFAVVDHTVDSSEFLSPPPPSANPMIAATSSLNKRDGKSDGGANIMTVKDYKANQLLQQQEAAAKKSKTADEKDNVQSVQQDGAGRSNSRILVRKIFPDDDEEFAKFSLEIQEIGGRMLSVLPKFLTKMNITAPSPFDQPNISSSSSPPGIFIFMIDLMNPAQIPTAAIELSYIRQTYLRQDHTARRRWCVVANKCMSLLSGNAPPLGHGRVAGGSVLTNGAVDAAELYLIRQRVSQLLLLPDHPDFSTSSSSSSASSADEDDFDDEDSENNEEITTSSDGDHDDGAEENSYRGRRREDEETAGDLRSGAAASSFQSKTFLNSMVMRTWENENLEASGGGRRRRGGRGDDIKKRRLANRSSSTAFASHFRKRPAMRSSKPSLILSSDGMMQRPSVVEDFVPPIFIVDTWTGTGMGDVISWLEDR